MTHLQFINFYESNLQALQNFAKKLTRSTADADDLVQETAFKAYRSLHTFKEGTSFKSWAFTILKNTFITRYNKRKRRSVVNTPVEEMSFALESGQAVPNEAISKIKVKEIKGCIGELSVKSRLPFLMHLEGYQYDEIADSLSIPIGTVKSRIHFARTKLKEMLSEKGIVAA